VGLKARRGDLSGPVLAILVTLVLLAIGAAIIAYSVLLGGAPQQGVVAVVGQPTIAKWEAMGVNNFRARLTIKNVGSTTISISSTDDVRLNMTGITVPATFITGSTLSPGAVSYMIFDFPGKWPEVADKEFVSGVLTIREVGTMEVVFRVVRHS
jgi:hypothetical protein